MDKSVFFASGAAVGLGALLVAGTVAIAPTLAQGAETGRGNGGGAGSSQQARGGGQGGGQQGRGSEDHANTAPSGTVTEEQKADLAFWVEEEKLAYDVYNALGAQYPDLRQFPNIAKSEAKHMDAVQQLLTTYGVADPTAGMAAGDFVNPDLQSLYDSLIASATTPEAALAAGVAIEQTDIKDLTAAKEGVTAPDMLATIDQQIKASERHLAAFSR